MTPRIDKVCFCPASLGPECHTLSMYCVYCVWTNLGARPDGYGSRLRHPLRDASGVCDLIDKLARWS